MTVFPAVTAKILVSSVASAPCTAALATLSQTAIMRWYTEGAPALIRPAACRPGLG